MISSLQPVIFNTGPINYSKKSPILYGCIVVVLFFLFMPETAVFAQPERLFFHHLLTSDGLSETYNEFIYKDKQGFVWMGSTDGINRFDGKKAINFRQGTGSLNILGKSITSTCFEDEKRGLMWFSTNQSLVAYDQNKHCFVSIQAHKSGKPVNKIYRLIHLNPDGSLIVLTDAVFYLFSPSSDSNLPDQYTSTPMGEVNSKFSRFGVITDPTSGKIQSILASDDYDTREKSNVHVFRINQNSIVLEKTILNGKEKKRVHSYISDSETLVWMATTDGLFQVNFASDEISQSHLTNLSLRDITRFDPQRFLCAVSKGGLILYNWQTRQIERTYKHNPVDPNSLSDDNVYNLYLDADRILWASTWKGMNFTHLDKIKFNTLGFDRLNVAGERDFIPKGMAEAILNEIWVGCDFTSSYRKIDKNNNITPEKLPKKALPTSQILRLKNGNIILNNEYEAGILAPDRTYSPIVSGNDNKWFEFSTAVEATDGICYIGSGNEVFKLVQKGKHYYPEKISIPVSIESTISHLAFDKTGRLLIGHDNTSLSICRKENEQWGLVATLHLHGQTQTTCETDDYLWAGGSYGLARIDKLNPLKHRFFTTEHGLPNNMVYGILPDDDDNLWFSTNKGIARFNILDSTTHSFTMADGLQDFEYNRNSFLKSSDGRMWFGGIKGINYFQPDKINYIKTKPNIVLTDIKINYDPYHNGQNVSLLENLTLRYNQNNIYIQYAALEYSDPSNIKVRHQLFYANAVPVDKAWREYTGNAGQAEYANLKSGHYILRIEAANSDGEWNPTPKLISIIIKKPFWEESIFLLVSGLFMLGGTVVYARRYIKKQLRWKNLLLLEKEFEIRQLKILEQEKRRLSDEMHDDLGLGLTTIVRKCERLADNTEYQNLEKPLREIADRADEVSKNMRHIIWALNAENNTLENLIIYITEKTGGSLEDHDISFSVSQPEKVTSVILTGEQRRNIFLAVQEAIHNVIKHSKATRVTMTFITDEISLRILIQDNGIGLTTSGSFGRGAHTMSERISALGGDIEVLSGEGVLVKISVPVKKQA